MEKRDSLEYEMVDYLLPIINKINQNLKSSKFDINFYKIFDKLLAYDKNRNILMSKQIGQFLFNDDTQDEILKLFNLPEDYSIFLAGSNMLEKIGAGKGLKEKIKKDGKLSHSGKETNIESTYNIYRIYLPLVLLSLTLYKTNQKEKQNLAIDLFIVVFLRLFSSIFQKYFRMGYIDEDRMEYTINNMQKNSLLVKYDSWYEILKNWSEENLNYFKNDSWSDKLIANNIYRSAVYGKLNSAMQTLAKNYFNNEKYLGHFSEYIELQGVKEDDKNSMALAKLETNSMIISELTEKVFGYLNRSPQVDLILLRTVLSTPALFNLNFKNQNFEMGVYRVEREVAKILNDATDNNINEFKDFIYYIFSYYLHSDETANKKSVYTKNFIDKNMKIFSTNNTNNINAIRILDFLKKLIGVSEKYAPLLDKENNVTLLKIKKTVFLYYLHLFQKFLKEGV